MAWLCFILAVLQKWVLILIKWQLLIIALGYLQFLAFDIHSWIEWNTSSIDGYIIIINSWNIYIAFDFLLSYSFVITTLNNDLLSVHVCMSIDKNALNISSFTMCFILGCTKSKAFEWQMPLSCQPLPLPIHKLQAIWLGKRLLIWSRKTGN